MIPRDVSRIAAFAVLLLNLPGCLSSTHAEDPVPGAIQRSVVVADGSGDGSLWVYASTLLPLSVEHAERWVYAAAGEGLWVGAGGRPAPTLEITDEAPGWARVTVKDGPFPGGSSGEEQADVVRDAWSDELLGLREWVAGVPAGSL